MPDSNFEKDLSQESLLAKHLDKIYSKVFEDSNYSVQRIENTDKQHQGIDLELSNGNKIFNVDEKAQLDYLNSSLPTFAFELSYLKAGDWRQGWLFDTNKLTDIYFLITSIQTDGESLQNALKKVNIIGVYRKRLLELLNSKGLTENVLRELEANLRKTKSHGRIKLNELDAKSEGVLFFSKDNKQEKPINLVLKLDFLLRENVGKTIYKL